MALRAAPAPCCRPDGGDLRRAAPARARRHAPGAAAARRGRGRQPPTAGRLAGAQHGQFALAGADDRPGAPSDAAAGRRHADPGREVAMPTAEAGLELERLAAADPTVAPLARLQAVALRATEDPAWEEGVP